MVKRVIVISFLFIFSVLSVFCIDPYESKSGTQVFSYSMQQKIAMEDAQERLDYLDEQGNVTIAADTGFSTKIITKYDQIIRESYYNPDGDAVRCNSGYHAVVWEYDQSNRLIRISYFDVDEKPILLSQGYSVEENYYDELGRKESVVYLDISGVPVCTKLEGYGKKYEYNSEGQISKIIYLDQYGKAMVNGYGYAIVVRSFYETDGYEQGKIENEFYYDINEKPIQLSLGQYGIHRDYIDEGESIKTTYLDINGKPMVTNKGYVSILRVNDGESYSESYYDLDGNPYKLQEGEYGIKRENGQTVFLNEDGSIQFNLRKQLNNHPVLIIPIAIMVLILAILLDRRFNVFLLIIYGICIIYFTLGFREIGAQQINMIPLSEFRIFFADAFVRSGIIKNIWLFIPFGAILYKLFPKSKILFIPIVFSAIIELVQYVTGLGWCDIDDIVSNCLGGVIGFEAGKTLSIIRNRKKK